MIVCFSHQVCVTMWYPMTEDRGRGNKDLNELQS